MRRAGRYVIERTIPGHPVRLVVEIGDRRSWAGCRIGGGVGVVSNVRKHVVSRSMSEGEALGYCGRVLRDEHGLTPVWERTAGDWDEMRTQWVPLPEEEPAKLTHEGSES